MAPAKRTVSPCVHFLLSSAVVVLNFMAGLNSRGLKVFISTQTGLLKLLFASKYKKPNELQPWLEFFNQRQERARIYRLGGC